MTENEISRIIYECAIEAHRTLGGPGLLESIYEEALAWEVMQRDLKVDRRVSVPIVYKGQHLATHLQIDLLVGEKVVVKYKATTQYNPIFRSATSDLPPSNRIKIRNGHQLRRNVGQAWDSSGGEWIVVNTVA